MPREAGDTDEPLRAWLMKRNQNRRMIGGQWSKRWVEINDERGRLHQRVLGRSAPYDGAQPGKLRQPRRQREREVAHPASRLTRA